MPGQCRSGATIRPRFCQARHAVEVGLAKRRLRRLRQINSAMTVRINAPKKPKTAPRRALVPAHNPFGSSPPSGSGPHVVSIGPCRACAHPHPTRIAKTSLMDSIKTRVATRRTGQVKRFGLRRGRVRGRCDRPARKGLWARKDLSAQTTAFSARRRASVPTRVVARARLSMTVGVARQSRPLRHTERVEADLRRQIGRVASRVFAA